jgi:flagellar hook-basal body complex protein FliE
MATPAFAAGAYAAMAKGLGGALGSAPGKLNGAAAAARGAEDGFSSLLNKALTTVAETGQKADAAGMAAATTGKGDVIDIVTAVADSEAAVSMLVGVRDRIIAAYQQIMNMPI